MGLEVFCQRLHPHAEGAAHRADQVLLVMGGPLVLSQSGLGKGRYGHCQVSKRLFELTRRPSLTRVVSSSFAETTKEPGCSQVKFAQI